jgi:uncharacterized peroxidase-related enzyme
MSERFPIYTADTSSEQARPILEGIARKYGFVPNVLGEMAEAPSVLQAYVTLGTLFDSGTLDPTERQVVALAASRENGCSYCVAAHSAAASMGRVPAGVVSSLRDDRPIADERLEALRRFTTILMARKGWVPEAEFEAFLDAGFTRAQAMEVALGVVMKSLSNLVNHLADTPVDEAFRPFLPEGSATTG